MTGLAAARVLLDRADHKLPSMGLTAMKGNSPERADIGVGKNYLLKDELYVLHILCEQFLLFVESKAIRGHQLTMAQLAEKFDELLAFQGHAIFPGYHDAIATQANAHAQKEFDLWRERVRHLPRDDRRLA